MDNKITPFRVLCLVLGLVFLFTTQLQSQNDTTIKRLADMRRELDQFLNGNSAIGSQADPAGHITVDKSAYDSLLNLVQNQQKALLELHKYIDAIESKLNIQRSTPQNYNSLSNEMEDDANMVFFNLGASLLNEKAKERLRKFFQGKDSKGLTIIIDGYADNRGTSKDNQLVSQRRAESVAAFLKTYLNLSSGQLKVNYHGYSNPRCTTSDEACNAKNRRVEVTIGSK